MWMGLASRDLIWILFVLDTSIRLVIVSHLRRTVQLLLLVLYSVALASLNASHSIRVSSNDSAISSASDMLCLRYCCVSSNKAIIVSLKYCDLHGLIYLHYPIQVLLLLVSAVRHCLMGNKALMSLDWLGLFQHPTLKFRLKFDLTNENVQKPQGTGRRGDEGQPWTTKPGDRSLGGATRRRGPRATNKHRRGTY